MKMPDNTNSYDIYQLNQNDDGQDRAFMSLSYLRKHGIPIQRDKYVLMYHALLRSNETLDDIYFQFNLDHPLDFKGHSLSVSDIVVLHKDGKSNAYYVDSFGFVEVPEFLDESMHIEQ